MMHNGTAVPTGGTARYSVPQVARLLGISERAVRKRITMGSLRAERAPQGWQILLEAVPGTVLDDAEAVPGTAVPPEPTAGTASTAATAVSDELVEQLRSEVAFLRQELQEQRERHTGEIAAWQERLREAHLLAAQRPALPPPDGTVGTAREDGQVPPVPPLRPWWAFWRRG